MPPIVSFNPLLARTDSPEARPAVFQVNPEDSICPTVAPRLTKFSEIALPSLVRQVPLNLVAFDEDKKGRVIARLHVNQPAFGPCENQLALDLLGHAVWSEDVESCPLE